MAEVECDVNEVLTHLDYNRKLAEKTRLSKEVSAIQLAFADRNHTTPDGRRLTNQDYWTWRKGETARMGELIAQLHDVKLWLGQRHHLSRPARKQKEPGKLDEYDLANALAEPEMLLQTLWARLNKKCDRHGWTDEDRGIVDAAHSYLLRKGMVLS